HIDDIVNGQFQSYGRVAAVTTGDSPSILFTLDASGPLLAGGIGANTLVYDASRRQLILGGCYQRITAGSSGDAATTKCGSASTLSGLIRFADVTAGPHGAVRTFDRANAVA